jgi:hypothetical protein
MLWYVASSGLALWSQEKARRRARVEPTIFEPISNFQTCKPTATPHSLEVACEVTTQFNIVPLSASLGCSTRRHRSDRASSLTSSRRTFVWSSRFTALYSIDSPCDSQTASALDKSREATDLNFRQSV